MVTQRRTRAGRSKRPTPGTTAYQVWAMLDVQKINEGAIDPKKIHELCEPMGLPRETVKSCIHRYKKHHRII